MFGFRSQHPMSRSRLPAFLLAVLLSIAATAGLAQPAPQPKAETAQDSQPGILSLLPPDSITGHTLVTEGGSFPYTATAGTFTLRGQDGKRIAAVFYTAYTRDAAEEDAAARPVTFVFNGGPGAASTYLHLGLVGPQVVDFGVPPAAATARLHDNPESWLRFTDLVLIDPVGTGWSRAANSEDNEKFWGVDSDAETIAKVIALYVAEHGLTAAPKYLLGESYGGFRAAKVARALQQDQGIVVSGIVMLSPLLDGGLTFRASRSALSAALLLPAIAATELDRRGRFTPEALAEAERFAMTDYLVTLAGPPPGGDAATTFYAKVAAMTGLPPEVVAQVVDKFVMQLEAQLADRHVAIELSDAARKWLAQKGFDPLYGARPLARVIKEHIKKPLAEDILFGKLEKGGTVRVDLDKEADLLVFEVVESKSKPHEETVEPVDA